MSRAAFDPIGALTLLASHGVDFVVIGGVAMRALGSNRVTVDTDICYARTSANLKRLAKALRAMNARRIADLYPGGVATEITTSYLEAETEFAFMTDYGQLDCIATPLGIEDFQQLVGMSESIKLGGVNVKVASPRALRQMKRASGSQVDRVDLLTLDEIERVQNG